MFFIECARLAERHPDLAAVLEQVDSRFGAMGTAEAIRCDDLASFLGADPNQVRSVLDMLAEEGVLVREDMIECPHCQMAALRSEYQAAMDEDGGYRCTSCDRPLTDGTIQAVATYRQGRKWADIPASGEGPDGERREAARTIIPTNAGLDEKAWYTHDRLAQIFAVGKDALRKRLDRYRRQNLNGWKEHEDRRPRESKYLYQLGAVRNIAEELRTSSERPAK